MWPLILGKAGFEMTEGRHGNAESLYLDVIEATRRVEGPGGAEEMKVRTLLADLYTLMGRYEEAETIYHETLRFHRRSPEARRGEMTQALWGIAQTQVATGDAAGALASIREALADFEGYRFASDPTYLYLEATRSILEGDREATLDFLYRAVEHDPQIAEWFERDLILAPLQDDPEFRALVAEAVRRDGLP
jgi:tetratricopeptide (TPR) repeat protein